MMKHLYFIACLFSTLSVKATCTDTAFVYTHTEVEFDKVRTKIYVEGIEEFVAFQFMLKYDETVVRFVNSEITFPPAGYLSNTNNLGEIRVLWTDDTGVSTFSIPDDNVIMEFEWELLQGGDAGIYIDETSFFSVEFVSPDMEALCVEVESNELLLEGYQLSGSVFVDDHGDCEYTDEVQQIPMQTIRIGSGQGELFRKTDEHGNYSALLPSGVYMVEVLAANNTWQSCGERTVELGSTDEVIHENLILASSQDCPYMEVEISTPRLRRCFDNNSYHINWQNSGSGIAEDSYVSIALDPALNFISVSDPMAFYQSETHSVLLDLGTVAPLDHGTFSINVEVQCEGVELGQTHCTTAYIYPNSPCDEDQLWSGAELSVKSECDGTQVKFEVLNTGSGDMDEATSITFLQDGVVMREESVMLVSEGQMDFLLDANGSTYTALVNQPAYYPYGSIIADAIELCGVNDNGGVSLGYITMFSNYDSSPHVDVDCTENIGSYDPNDKQAWPKGYAETDLIENHVKLDYMIRFQNTGTDTAFNIVVKDTLSEYLDVSSLRIGASSHNFEFGIEDERTLVWRFPNILLPDSTVNMEGSNGFVKFSIDQVPNNPDGTIIDNSASIYFDFNEPIVTNVVRREVGSDFLLMQVGVNDEGSIPLEIYPNPTRGMLYLQTDSPLSEFNYELYDISSQLLGEGRVKSGSINLNSLESGVYVLHLLDDKDEVMAIRKVVIVQ